MTIGRQKDRVDIHLDNTDGPATISRLHASLTVDSANRVVTIKDEKSVNGVFVNNRKISERALAHGDTIIFGGGAGIPVDTFIMPDSQFVYCYADAKLLAQEEENDAREQAVKGNSRFRSVSGNVLSGRKTPSSPSVSTTTAGGERDRPGTPQTGAEPSSSSSCSSSSSSNTTTAAAKVATDATTATATAATTTTAPSSASSLSASSPMAYSSELVCCFERGKKKNKISGSDIKKGLQIADFSYNDINAIESDSLILVKDSLSHLYLSWNKLRTFPNDLRELTNLKELHMWNNSLGHFPNVSKLTKLEVLDLSGNKISVMSAVLADLVRLTTLNLSHNTLRAMDPSVGRLANLTKLNLSNNNLSHLTPAVGKLQSLKLLMLQENELQELPQEITAIASLEMLFVQNNSLQKLPDGFDNLKHIEKINLNSNKLQQLPASLARLQVEGIVTVQDNPFLKRDR